MTNEEIEESNKFGIRVFRVEEHVVFPEDKIAALIIAETVLFPELKREDSAYDKETLNTVLNTLIEMRLQLHKECRDERDELMREKPSFFRKLLNYCRAPRRALPTPGED